MNDKIEVPPEYIIKYFEVLRNDYKNQIKQKLESLKNGDNKKFYIILNLLMNDTELNNVILIDFEFKTKSTMRIIILINIDNELKMITDASDVNTTYNSVKKLICNSKLCKECVICYNTIDLKLCMCNGCYQLICAECIVKNLCIYKKKECPLCNYIETDTIIKQQYKHITEYYDTHGFKKTCAKFG